MKSAHECQMIVNPEYDVKHRTEEKSLNFDLEYDAEHRTKEKSLNSDCKWVVACKPERKSWLSITGLKTEKSKNESPLLINQKCNQTHDVNS